MQSNLCENLSIHHGIIGISPIVSHITEQPKSVRRRQKEIIIIRQSLKKDISIVNDKVDRLMYTKDVEGYENMKIQVGILTQGYQELKEKFQP